MSKHFVFASSAVALIGLTSFSQSYALSLGDIAVNSTLGQPLDAVVRVSAAPGEKLQADCFSVVHPSSPGLPPITNVRLSLTKQLSPGALRLRGTNALREPMSEIVLRVDCPGVPKITRTFMVLVDPPSDPINTSAPATVRALSEPSISATPVAAPVRGQRRAVVDRDISSGSARVDVRPRFIMPNEPIIPGTQYIVQPGDVLSVIASRVQGRPEYSVWPIAQRIFDTNRNAFDNGDPDLLVVGATVRIPALDSALVDNAPHAAGVVVGAPAQAARVARLGAPPGPAPTPSPNADKPAPATVRASAVGNITQPLPTMVLSRSLSTLSVDRLRLRRSGQIQVAPTAALDEPPVPEVPTQPATAVITRPAQPVPTTRQIQVITKPRFWLWDWLILAAGFIVGGLIAVFGLRRWVRNEREQQDLELQRAKRHQERLDESRRQRTITEDPAIVVHEARPHSDTSANIDVALTPDFVPEIQSGPVEVPIVPDEEVAPVAEEEPLQTALAVDDLSADDGLDFDVFEAPNEVDLEMLARDYAQSTSDIRKLDPGLPLDEDTAMIDPAQLGLHQEGTAIMHSGLDLELPENDDSDGGGVEIPRAATNVSDSDATEEGLQFDPQMLELDYNLAEEAAPGKVADDAPPLTLEDPTSAINTRDNEDYYHLEASSIRKIDSLSFETDADDESKILAFRKPAGRTGTDDDPAGS